MMRNMTDFMSDHACELVRRPGAVDQALEHVDVPSGKRDRVCFLPAHDHDLEGPRQGCGCLDLLQQFVECRAAGLLVLRIAAFECSASAMVVQARAGLRCHGSSELAFEGIRNERRERGREQRHAHDREQDERHAGGDTPQDNLVSQPALDAPGAVNRRRSLIYGCDELRIRHLEAREHGVPGFADA